MSWPVMEYTMIWPLAWLVYTFVRGALTGWYPYPFLDVDLIGFGDSVRNCAVILVIALGIAALLTILDKRLPALVHDGGGRRRPVRSTETAGITTASVDPGSER
jgi:hypothetical protein